MIKFSGKVALVVGATSGIGRETAIQFALSGAKVVLAGRRCNKGIEAADEIRKLGGEASFIEVDMSSEGQVKSLINKTIALYGQLDYAFNNGAIEGERPLLVNESVENCDRVLAVNVRGVMLSMKYEIAQMLNGNGGAIVNTSSVAGMGGLPNGSAYSASKHAVIGLTKSAALEVARQGIRINAISPGGVDTEMARRLVSDMDAFGDWHPMGRVSEPSEIAGAVLFLCSDDASFITGVNLPIDGGLTAR